MKIEFRNGTFYKSDRKTKPAWIVIHYTGTNAGALANARALERRLKNPVSTHFFVEGRDVLQCVDTDKAAWHIGGKDPLKKLNVFNGNSIGVDLCEKKRRHVGSLKAQDADWYFTEETETTGAELVAWLMQKYQIPLEHVVRHYDVTGKLCPRPFVGDDLNEVYKESGNQRWQRFLGLVKKAANGELR